MVGDTTPPDTTDIWAPCYSDWFPESGELVPGADMGVAICDICEGAEYYTGVDPESIEFGYWTLADSVWHDVSDEVILAPIFCAGYGLSWRVPPDFAAGDYRFCVEASDYAGNRSGDCHRFTVIDTTPPPPVDSCPPVVMSWSPEDGAEGVSPTAFVWAYLSDPPGGCEVSSGVDPESIEMIVVIGDDTLDVSDELEIVGHGTVEVSWYHRGMPFPRGAHIEVCIYFSDNAGNRAHDCIEFDIEGEPPDTTDIWAPCFVNWIPEPGHLESLAGVRLSVDVCDICDGSEYATGVNPETFEGILIHDGDTVEIPMEYVDRMPLGECLGYRLFYYLGMHYEWEGEVTVCLWASDYAGNRGHDCATYMVGDTTPPDTTDIWAPCAMDWETDVHFISFPSPHWSYDSVFVNICDDCSGATFVSGVNPESIELFLVEGADTILLWDFDILPSTECEGYQVRAGIMEAISFEACVYAQDFAGNSSFACHFFDTLEAYPDSVPPCYSYIFPTDEDTVMEYFTYRATICDDCPGSGGLVSGVNPDSVYLVVHTSWDDSLYFSSDELELIPNSCSGFDVNKYIHLSGSGRVAICLYASDNVGNSSHTCTEFSVVEPPDTTDIWAPCYSDWFPEGGELMPGMDMGVPICDICEGAEYYTGVDPESIEFGYMTSDSVWYDLSDEIELIPIYCAGYALVWRVPPDFAAGDYRFCVEASDYAGNRSGDCHWFVVVGDTTDRIPPRFTGEFPEDMSDSVALDTYISVNITDSDGEYPSGVDSSTIEMLIVWHTPGGDSGFYPVPHEYLVMVEIGSYAYTVIYTPPFDLPCGANIRVVVSASDYAGNAGVFDWRFLTVPCGERLHTLVGTVRNDETDEPLEGILVCAFRHYGEPIFDHCTVTNDSGEFSLDVTMGEFILGAFDSTGNYNPQFFDHKANPMDADVIFITPDTPDTLFGFNFDLIPMIRLFYLSGAIFDEDTTTPLPHVLTVAISTEDEEEWATAGVTNSEGEYELRVPPGSYYLLAYHPGFIPMFYNDVTNWHDATPIPVDTADASGYDVHLLYAHGRGGGAYLDGYVEEDTSSFYKDDEIPLVGSRVYLVNPENGEYMYATYTYPDGYFRFDDILPGVYRVEFDKVLYEPTTSFPEMEIAYADTETVHFVLRRGGTGIAETDVKPLGFAIYPAYPNPFNSYVHLPYELFGDADVEISVRNVLGEQVAEVFSGKQRRGSYIVAWDASDVPSGVYFITVKAKGELRATKVMLLR